MGYSPEKTPPLLKEIKCPILPDVPRISGGITQMCRDLSCICDAWGIYNDYTKEPESDPLVRQFLSVSLLFGENGEERIDTIIYKDFETKKIIFRYTEHFQKAKKATQYVVNKTITESPVKAIHRRLKWEEVECLE